MAPTTTTTAAFPTAATATPIVEGERFESRARLVIAPASGVYEPVRELRSGAMITAGQVVGHLTSGRTRTAVVSPFAGQTGDWLACSGERLTPHQPVMWLSVEGRTP